MDVAAAAAAPATEAPFVDGVAAVVEGGGGAGAPRRPHEDEALPQPRSALGDGLRHPLYRYVAIDRVQPRTNDDDGHNKAFHHDQLVWVCKSKGRGGKRRRKGSSSGNEDDGDGGDDKSTAVPSSSSSQQQQQHQRLELFLRARVVLDPVEGESAPKASTHPPLSTTTASSDAAQDRIRVRYPLGSTYQARRDHLIPVLETERNLVLVVSETPAYRRCCAVHTLPHEYILEIGSDLGFNVKRLSELGSGGGFDSRRRIVGVDKSEYSVRTASVSFPHLTFVQWDSVEQLQQQLRRCRRNDTSVGTTTLSPSSDDIDDYADFVPDVVALDINGNRDLPAVLKCLDALFNLHDWEPRLIIVKSRTLYAQLLQRNPPQQQQQVERKGADDNAT